jgi:methylmalonyl-CoA mutase N-terminal domain/subunit
MLRAVESGYVQREIQNAAYREQQRQERSENCTVGVNCFTDARPVEIPLLRISAEIEREQIARLRSLRQRRDKARVDAAIRALTEAARTSEQLLDPILEAVEASATVGEIVHALKSEFHEHTETVVI